MTKDLYVSVRHTTITKATSSKSDGHNMRYTQKGAATADPEFKDLNETTFFYGSKTLKNAVAEFSKAEGVAPAKRKDAAQAVEQLLTFTPDFFKIEGLDFQTNRRAYIQSKHFQDFKRAVEDHLKKEHGKNLLYLSWHLDETTPHVHAMFAPVFDFGDGVKRWTVASSVQGKEKRFYGGMNSDYCKNAQTSLAKSLAKFGFKRGIPKAETKRKHVKQATWVKAQENAVNAVYSVLQGVEPTKTQKAAWTALNADPIAFLKIKDPVQKKAIEKLQVCNNQAIEELVELREQLKAKTEYSARQSEAITKSATAIRNLIADGEQARETIKIYSKMISQLGEWHTNLKKFVDKYSTLKEFFDPLLKMLDHCQKISTDNPTKEQKPEEPTPNDASQKVENRRAFRR